MGESKFFGDGKAMSRSGSKRPGVTGMAMLVRLLFADCVMLPWECSKPLLRMLKLSLVNTAGSMVSTGSSGIVVVLIGRLY